MAVISASTLVVVINWNGWPLTSRCLADLAASGPRPDVLCIDNGSTDPAGVAVDEGSRRPEQTIVRLPQNVGFAAAANIGLARAREAGYAFVWLLNNDVRVPPDTLARLIAHASASTSTSVWTPRLLNADGTDQHVGGTYALDGSGPRLLTCDMFVAASASASESRWLSGTSLFCRTDVAARIGAFDESFFAYWEDVDWSFRARRLGIDLRAAADAAITHLVSQATGGRGSDVAAFLNARNELIFLRKHLDAAALRRVTRRVIARQLRWALLLDRRGGELQARSVLAGLIAGRRGRHGPPSPTASTASTPSTALSTTTARRVLGRALACAHRLDTAS